jgi:large subunit ribosomal protein L6
VSRIGRTPIPLGSGVSVERVGDEVRVKGPKGSLAQRIPTSIALRVEDGRVLFDRPDDRKPSRALHGLARALVANMVRGVQEPFVKELEIQGVGYRADVSGKKLSLALGFSHPVEMPIPEGIRVSVDRNVLIRIEGIDKQQVGQFAADVRGLRPPEPYKGKGVRYLNEIVRRKVGKAGASGAGGG